MGHGNETCVKWDSRKFDNLRALFGPSLKKQGELIAYPYKKDDLGKLVRQICYFNVHRAMHVRTTFGEGPNRFFRNEKKEIYGSK